MSAKKKAPARSPAKAATTKPATTKPARSPAKAATTKPATTKPATTKPATTKPATTKAGRKSAARKQPHPHASLLDELVQRAKAVRDHALCPSLALQRRRGDRDEERAHLRGLQRRERVAWRHHLRGARRDHADGRGGRARANRVRGGHGRRGRRLSVRYLPPCPLPSSRRTCPSSSWASARATARAAASSSSPTCSRSHSTAPSSSSGEPNVTREREKSANHALASARCRRATPEGMAINREIQAHRTAQRLPCACHASCSFHPAALLGCAVLVSCTSSTRLNPQQPRHLPATNRTRRAKPPPSTMPSRCRSTARRPSSNARCALSTRRSTDARSFVPRSTRRRGRDRARPRSPHPAPRRRREVPDDRLRGRRCVDAFRRLVRERRRHAALDKYVKAVGSTLGNTKNVLALFEAFREMKLALPAGERLDVRGIDVAITQQPALDTVFAYLQKASPRSSRSGRRSSRRGIARRLATRRLRSASTQRPQGRLRREDGRSVVHTLRSRPRGSRRGLGIPREVREGSFFAGNAEFRDPAMSRNLLRVAADGNKTVVVERTSVTARRDWPSSGLPQSGGLFAFGKAVHESLGNRYRVVAQESQAAARSSRSGEVLTFEFPAKGLEKALSEAVESPFALLPVHGSDPVNLDKAWALERLPEEDVKLGDRPTCSRSSRPRRPRRRTGSRVPARREGHHGLRVG